MADEAATAPALNKRQQAKERTRRKVLATARDLFEAIGYEKATIRLIADEAGLSTGAIFANFEDKHALYVAAFGHKPLTPEDGRVLLHTLRKIWAVRPENWNDGEDAEGQAAWTAGELCMQMHGPAPAAPEGGAA